MNLFGRITQDLPDQRLELKEMVRVYPGLFHSLSISLAGIFIALKNGRQ